MTKEELDSIIKDTHVSSMEFCGDDPLKELVLEVLFEGYCDGMKHAANTVHNLDETLYFVYCKDFLKKNMEKIRKRVSAIKEYESTGGVSE